MLWNLNSEFIGGEKEGLLDRDYVAEVQITQNFTPQTPEPQNPNFKLLTLTPKPQTFTPNPTLNPKP